METVSNWFTDPKDRVTYPAQFEATPIQGGIQITVHDKVSGRRLEIQVSRAELMRLWLSQV